MLFPKRPPWERTLLYGAALAIYGAAWAPWLGQWLVNQRLNAALIGGAGLAACWLGLCLHRRLPRLGRALAIPYWIVLLTTHLLFGYMARWANPPYFWLAVLVGLAAFLPLGDREKRLAAVLTAATLLAAGFAAATLRHYSWIAAVAGAALWPPLGAGLFWLARKRRLASFSRLAVAVAAFAVMIYPSGFVQYSFVFPELLPRVTAQPGVQALYDYLTPRARETFCSQVMYLAKVPGRELYVTGPQNPCRRLNVFSPAAPELAASLDLDSRSTDNLAFDPDDPNVAYVGTVTDLVKVSLDPPCRLESRPLHQTARNLNFIHYDPLSDRLLVSQDYGPNVFVAERRSLKAKSRLAAPGMVTDDVWPDPLGDQIFVSGTYAVGWQVMTYDKTSLAPRHTYRWFGDIGFHFSTIDPWGRRAYLGSTTSGKMRVLDLDTLQPLGDVQLEVGLRNLGFDPVRRLVLVSSYFRGNLFVYSPAQSKVIGKIFLGPRLRWVQVDAESGQWYATSAVGGFAVDPEKALGNALPPRIDTKK